MEPTISPPPAPTPPPPPHPRLTRSSRDRMWAGVAGGMAEYFDLDPALVRLIWVAAAILSGGLAVPVYILAWVILPRDDRPPAPAGHAWHDWSQEVESEAHRLAEEARRLAAEVRGTSSTWWPGAPSREPIQPTSGQTEPTARTTESTYTPSEPTYGAAQPTYPGYSAEPYHHNGRRHRSTGIVLVTLGLLLLGANMGVFNWIDLRVIWPLIFIGLGVALLARRADAGRW